MIKTRVVNVRMNHLQEKFDDLSFPYWPSTHQDFVLKNKIALESNYVSTNLHKWIDMVIVYL